MFQSGDLEGIVNDQAVWSPIYAISGTLDKTLSEIFMPDHVARLEAAKERLRAYLYGETGQSSAPSDVAATGPQAHQMERGTAGDHSEAGRGR